MNILFSPLIAFLVYLGLVGLLALAGKKLAGPSTYNSVKSSTYSSGEAAPTSVGVPGYRPFFVVALFFAVLHLGVLVLGVWPGLATWLTAPAAHALLASFGG